MRLALIRQTYNPFGGAERFVERTLAALSQTPLEVTLIARHWQGESRHATLRCNPLYVGRLWRDWSFARVVQRHIRQGGFDLVQSHERIAGCDVFRAGDGVHATWLERRAPTLSTLARVAQALSPWHRYTCRAEAAMFRHPRLRAVICNSRMVAHDIAKRFGVQADKLRVIYNGIDPARFHLGLAATHRAPTREAYGADAHTPVVLYVGSGFARKGVAALIEALAAMRRNHAVLWVVGQDKHAGRYARLAQRLGVADRVRFFGGQKDVTPFYGAADVFALPTLYDPFPNAAIEALACGLPLLTSHDSGAAECVTEGANGHVCGARDIAALADRLDTLCAPGHAANLRQAAADSVRHLSMDNMRAAMETLYRDLLAAGPEAP